MEKTVMQTLQDKVAMVPGGATLIGEAVIDRLVVTEARVVVIDIDAAGGARVAAHHLQHVQCQTLGLTDDVRIEAGVAHVLQTHDDVHALT